MHCFSAISVGSRVKPHRVTGAIHSVFVDACNLESADGGIITLLAARTPDQPGGIRLATPPDFSFRRHLSASDRVSCRPGFVEVPDRAFIVDLRHAASCRRQLPAARIGVTVSNWEAATDAFLSMSRGSVPEPSNSATGVWDLADALTRAVADGDWQTARGTMRALIGRGPGLTPWGDDFVSGFLAGYECFAADQGIGRALTRLRGLCRDRVGATTDISRSILLDATAGLYGAPVYDLCETIVDPGSHLRVAEQVRSYVNIGDSSGEAGCYGILSGISAASGREDTINRLKE